MDSQDLVRIKSIDVIPIRYPMVGRFKFFEGPEGSPSGRPSVLVKVTAEDGNIGWGQSVPIPKWSYESLESVTLTLENYLIPPLIGHNIFDPLGAHKVMNENIAGSFSTGMPIAKAGIDLALHDLIGILLRKNVADILGKCPKKKLELSWTLNPSSLSDLEPLIEDGLSRGYRHFNVKVSPDPVFDLELCRRTKALVPDGFLWADANGGYSVEQALEIAPKLANCGVDVLEQPIKPNRISGYQALKQQRALPILMDEGVVSPVDLAEFIRLELLDGVAMKPARCAGIVSSRRMMEMLRENGLLVLASGLTDPDISLAASLCLFGAYEYDRPAALNGPQFISYSILRNPLKPSNGEIAVPKGIGLGVEVDEDALQRVRVRI